MSEEDKNVQSQQDSLDKLIGLQEKELKAARLTSIFMAVILVVLLIAVIAVVPGVLVTLRKANIALDQITATVSKADGTLDHVKTSLENADNMTAEAEKAAKGLNDLLDENGDDLSKSIDELAKVDFEGLANAVKNLNDAMEPIARLLGR